MADDWTWREVTKDEFRAWLEAYPRPLLTEPVRVCEPEFLGYFDETLGPYPGYDGLVAKDSHIYELTEAEQQTLTATGFFMHTRPPARRFFIREGIY